MVFEYTTETVQEVQVFSLAGDLIEQNQAAPMMYEIERLISKFENKIILDLAKVNYINSSGLNVLIKILTKSRKSGGDVAIINVTPKINELLVITKLNSVFNVCASREEAFSRLNQ